MKNVLFLLVLIYIPLLGYSQGNYTSHLYTSNGKLIADTTLQISKTQYEYWRRAEEPIIGYLAYQMDFSPVAKRNAYGGRLIVAFNCTRDSLSNIRIVSNKLGAKLDEEAISGIEKSKRYIINEFIYIKDELLKDQSNFNGTYYIPIDFLIVDFYKKLEHNHAVPFMELTKPNHMFRTRIE